MSFDPGHIELEWTVESIRVGRRHRTELGDIDELAASIERDGLLQPITVTPDGVLVCGARRLAAIKRLGEKKVNVWVRSGLSDRLGQLLAEQDDNMLHKPLTQREAAALYRELLGVDPDPVVGRRWAEAARRRAAKNGWAPPGAWHDIDHDDTPENVTDELEDEATPTLNAASMARARRREDAVDLIAGGFAPDVVRERLQIKGPVTELYRLLREAGRDDLVAVAELDHKTWKDQAA